MVDIKPNKMIKARFRGVTNEEKATFNRSRCLLPISVGMESHEGERFEATIDYVKDHFAECVILVTDTLQRHTLALDSPKDPDSLINLARAQGDAWLIRNERYYRKIKNCKIVRWDTYLLDPKFNQLLKQVKELMEHNEDYKKSFEDSTEWFVDKYQGRLRYPQYFDRERAKNIVLNYIIEESVAICLAVDLECEFEAYPGAYLDAVDRTKYHFMSPQNPHLQKKILIDFRNANILPPQQTHIDLIEYIDMLEKILSASPALIYWMNKDKVYLGCNDQEAALLKLNSRFEIVGKRTVDFKNLFGQEMVDYLNAVDTHVINEKKPLSIEDSVTIAGESKIFLTTKTPLTDRAGKVIGLVGVSVDITDRRKAEELKVENEIKKRELAIQDQLAHIARLDSMNAVAVGIAHEVNQPLSAIANYSAAAQRFLEKIPQEVVPDQLGTALAKIKEAAERAGKIIHELKNFVRKDADSKPEFYSVNILVSNVLGFAKHKLQETKIETKLNLEHELKNIFINKIQIEQVLLNLINNAIDAVLASRGEKRSITITTKQLDSEEISVSVTDTGIGMTPEAQKKLFTPFTSTKSHGMGIGLSLCHNIIEKHLGRINVTSELGKGSTFEVILPIKT